MTCIFSTKYETRSSTDTVDGGEGVGGMGRDELLTLVSGEVSLQEKDGPLSGQM